MNGLYEVDTLKLIADEQDQGEESEREDGDGDGGDGVEDGEGKGKGKGKGKSDADADGDGGKGGADDDADDDADEDGEGEGGDGEGDEDGDGEDGLNASPDDDGDADDADEDGEGGEAEGGEGTESEGGNNKGAPGRGHSLSDVPARLVESPEDAELIIEIEPTPGDMPLSETAKDGAVAQTCEGCYNDASNYGLESVGSLGFNTARLSYELKLLLDKSDTDHDERGHLSGRLTRNWAAIARGEEAVFKRRYFQDGIDSAVLIAIDQSRSMAGPAMRAAHDTTMVLADALRRCNGVKFQVQTFSDGYQESVAAAWIEHDKRRFGASWLVYKHWNESLGAFLTRSAHLCATRGGTPEVAALQDCLRQLTRRPEERKVLIWIGDGSGYSADAIRKLQQKYPGIVILAFGMGVDLSPYFKHSLQVNSARDLATLSMRSLVNTLRKEMKVA